jgi:hypothetical protein
MSWTWRRGTQPWQWYLDRLLDLVLAGIWRGSGTSGRAAPPEPLGRPLWQRSLDRFLDLVLLVLGAVFLIELFLLFR